MKILPFLTFFLLLLAACQPSLAPKTIPSPSAIPDQDLSIPTTSLVDPPGFLFSSLTNGSSLAEVALMTERWKETLLAETGWLYLRRQIERGPNAGIVWDTLPARYLEETWLLLGEKSEVRLAVRQEISEEGQVLQQSLYQNGSWRNLTLGAESKTPSASLLELDYGFTSLAARLHETGAALNRQTLYNNCWYIGEKYMIGEPPYSYAAAFNPDNGMLRQFSTWKVVSGSVLLVEKIDVVAQEKIPQPPDEVLLLIDLAADPGKAGLTSVELSR